MPRDARSRRRASVRRVARGVLVAVLLAGFAVALNGAFGAAQEGADDSDVIARGRQLYGTACATCHAEEGRGDPDRGIPPLQGVGAAAVDFYLRTGRMPIDDVDERPVHRDPLVTDPQREALVAYITTFPGTGPDIPDPGGWESASLARGLELFTQDCAACHGPTAAGIAVGQEDISSDLSDVTPLEIAEAIRIGPGVMPVFGEEQLPQDDMEALIGWIQHLTTRESPGGLQIGRSGPVSEGLIAWVLGMGLLMIVIYLLGDKASDEDQSHAE